jgi:long-subunit acyl-CoA synthetase (AMP-forming)
MLKRHETYRVVPSPKVTKIDDSCFVSAYPEIGIITCRLGIGKRGNIGFMAQNIELMIIDCNTGMKVGPKQSGEICCKSPFMMNGYYNMLMESAIDPQGLFASAL